jgi:acetyltransferase
MPTTDPAHDVLRSESQPLDVFFKPKSVAVIGATETPGSVGRTILQNLISSPFGGTVFPINPKRNSILGIKAYPNIASAPDPVELAVIVTPAASVPDLIGECVAAGVKAAIIISAGFKETGPEGAELERRVLEKARAGNLRLIGPNCLGVMSPLNGMNATFAQTIALPGNVAFISQSGALLTAVLDYSLREKIGFSAFVSIGSMLDVGWGDLINYLGNDPKTQSIVIYMESIGDARGFLSAAREVALTKPIIVIKAGRTSVGAKAAASHTGTLTGSDDVLNAAFQRCGVLRVTSIADLFYMAEVLSKQPRPRGPRLTILTNAGGPGVLATDALITGGGELAEVSPETIEELNAILPAAWSHNNPIDVLGDAGADRYAKALQIAAQDPKSDGLLVILTPQAMTDATATADLLRPYAKIPHKPILASWMGGETVAAGERHLNDAGIPSFAYPDTAARVFNYMWSYSENLRELYETPQLPTDPGVEYDAARAEAIIEGVRKSGRTILTEPESKDLLTAYNIPTVETRIAATEEEARRAADEIGYPIVVKIYSETITHKTDVGGVQLNLKNADAVGAAYKAIEESVRTKVGAEHFQGVTVQPMVAMGGYEVIIGSSIDPQFGPVLLFGSGGQLVEVYEDRALALPPLTTTLARRMMEQTKVFKALQGVRGRASADIPALEQLLVRFSQLVVTQPWIAEIDINPLLVSPERFLALDARVVLHPVDTKEEDLPKPAIRPYPVQYVRTWTARDGEAVTLRPIRPEDEPLVTQFHETLSERSVYLRYFQPLKLDQRVAHNRLIRICFNDYDREIALVAQRQLTGDGHGDIVAIARLSKIPGRSEANFSLLVSDLFQNQGVGSEMLRQLVQIARDEKLARLTAEMLSENYGMQAICRKLGFTLTPLPDMPSVTYAVLEL